MSAEHSTMQPSRRAFAYRMRTMGLIDVDSSFISAAFSLGTEMPKLHSCGLTPTEMPSERLRPAVRAEHAIGEASSLSALCRHQFRPPRPRSVKICRQSTSIGPVTYRPGLWTGRPNLVEARRKEARQPYLSRRRRDVLQVPCILLCRAADLVRQTCYIPRSARHPEFEIKSRPRNSVSP